MPFRQSIHLVGSVPLKDTEAVFRALAERLGPRAPRYPDGETGARTNWIRWQQHIFEDNPAFELVAQQSDFVTIRDKLARPFYRLRPEASADSITFNVLGFANEAIKSYAIFDRLKQEGVIPQRTRFQVSLPTVVAILSGFVLLEDRARAESALDAAMTREVAAIAAAIPHRELAVQWDICLELVGYDGGFPLHLTNILSDSVDRIVRQIALVPEDVEVGVHLCYGDPGHTHIVEPRDTRSCVTFANAIAAGLSRSLDWLHLPIARDWTESKYYEPLADLALPTDTEIYLGLIHLSDGQDGAELRRVIATQFVPQFGIATECGFGRRDPSTIAPLLDLHRHASGAVDLG